MKERIPLTSKYLQEKSNQNTAKYGYQEENESNKTIKGFEETYRTGIRRQRDKILYTGGFRRLQDKTQVMSSTISGDHRTRLTHTLEVEQIAVSIANALKLNADLVSAIALGHDVGHTPFGHAAERKLNELLKDCGGFHHPIQSVKYLWEKYENKIVPEIYEGILLHDSDMFTIEKEEAKKQLKFLKNGDNVGFEKYFNQFPSTLEAQVVIWSDKIAYITHDLEDFLRSQIYVNVKKTNTKIEDELCEILNELIEEKEIETLEKFELRDLIRNINTNLIISSCNKINNLNDFTQKKVKNLTEERNKNEEKTKQVYLDNLIINFDDKYRDSYYKLRKFLDYNYILSPEVQRSDAKAQVIVEWLFNKLSGNYKLMPLNIRDDIDKTIIFELEKDEKLKEVYDKLTNEQEKLSYFQKINVKYNEIKDIINNSRMNSDKEKKTIETEVKKDNELKKIYDIFDEKGKSFTYFQEIMEKGIKMEKNVIFRKVATYIATMSDTYAENMYRNLIGSRVDFIL